MSEYQANRPDNPGNLALSITPQASVAPFVQTRDLFISQSETQGYIRSNLDDYRTIRQGMHAAFANLTEVCRDNVSGAGSMLTVSRLFFTDLYERHRADGRVEYRALMELINSDQVNAGATPEGARKVDGPKSLVFSKGQFTLFDDALVLSAVAFSAPPGVVGYGQPRMRIEDIQPYINAAAFGNELKRLSGGEETFFPNGERSLLYQLMEDAAVKSLQRSHPGADYFFREIRPAPEAHPNAYEAVFLVIDCDARSFQQHVGVTMIPRHDPEALTMNVHLLNDSSRRGC